MVLDSTPKLVELTYAGQDVEITETTLELSNDRKKAEIDLSKILETDKNFSLGINGEIKKIVFGLYADADITAADGTSIPKDGLLELVNVSESGKAAFSSDLPEGNFYVKEYSTDSHYQLSKQKFPVKVDFTDDSAVIHIKVNQGKPIENKLIRGSIQGQKVDEDGFGVEGCLFGLFKADETEFTEKTAILTSASNQIGVFGFQNVPYGKYLIREISCPAPFILNETIYPVEITRHNALIEITAENKFVTGSVQTIKVDQEYPENRLSGAVFEAYVDVDHNKEIDPTVDLLAGELTEVEKGLYQLDGLRYNGYFLHEKSAPAGFVPDKNYYYFEIRQDGELVTVENEAGIGFTNRPMKGQLEITKTDETGKVYLPDTGFRITDLNDNIVAEGYTDKNGKVTFSLRTGSYICTEFAAASGYLKSDIEYPFEITEDGQVITISVTNSKEPSPDVPETGDFTPLMFLIGLTIISGGVMLVLSVRKFRKTFQLK